MIQAVIECVSGIWIKRCVSVIRVQSRNVLVILVLVLVDYGSDLDYERLRDFCPEMPFSECVGGGGVLTTISDNPLT